MKTKIWLKRGLFGFVALVTLLGLVIAIENVRGKRAWMAYTAEVTAKGGSLDWLTFMPPGVPDAENMAAVPWLAPYVDYVTDPVTKRVRLRDSNACERVVAPYSWIGQVRQESTSWREGAVSDLARWVRHAEAIKASLPPEIAQMVSVASNAPPAEVLLGMLAQRREALERLREAARRPGCNFKLRYGEGLDCLLDQFRAMKQFGIALSFAAVVEQAAGRNDDAMADILATFRWADAAGSEPLLISLLVRFAIAELGVQAIWDGLAAHRWSEGQLAILDAALAKRNLIAASRRSLSGERAFAIAALSNRPLSPGLGEPGVGTSEWAALRYMPSGWIYQNEISIARTLEERVLAHIKTTEDGGWIDLKAAGGAAAVRPGNGKFRLYSALADMLVPAVSNALRTVAAAQATSQMARIAIALERYRLANGSYPAQLVDLVPKYLPMLPVDPVNGAPFLYRVLEDKRFVLYSVGNNLKDDGGEIALDKNGRLARHEARGDWVWRYPAGK